MTYKKRILLVNESSALATGFSVMARELLPRLVATGKFEIAELASYGKPNDPSILNFINGRWKYYFAWPKTREEEAEFNKISNHPRDRGQNINQFGAMHFDEVCADFKPDIIIDWRDNWMTTWQLRSPFRQFIKIIWMPTVDSLPLLEEWIEDNEKVDLCLGYSDFGVHQLKTQSPKIRVLPTPMRPGVDLKIFHPMDKTEVRDYFNLSKDIPIVGTVQRNQSRKLILDLIDSFSLMKTRYKGVPEVDKAVLLLHTSWPDNAYSYDYPRHIYRLSNYKWLPFYHENLKASILQTFQCHDCHNVFVGYAVSLYKQPVQGNQIFVPCAHCGKKTATCPTTGKGVTREQLAKIYNLIDIYVQASIAEGEGIPQIEAKACGVMTIGTDWSATAEKGRFPKEYVHLKDKKEEDYSLHWGGDIIKVKSLRHEPETGCFRAFIDHEDLTDKLHYYLTHSDIRQEMSKKARLSTELNYDWDKIAKEWERVLDLIKIKDRKHTWETPIVVKDLNTVQFKDVPANLTDEAFIDWLYLNVMKYNVVDPEGRKMWLSYFPQGATREAIFNQFVNIANQQIGSEQARQLVRAAVAAQNGEPFIDERKKSDEQWI
jgi:glycosyltransferase involved in cell wall biosynthesis